MRHYRLGVPAVLVAGVYVVTVAVAAVSALVSGDTAFLWRLTLLFEQDEEGPVTAARLLIGQHEGSPATWPKVLVLLAAGGLWAWALWQSLRGPVAGPRPPADRGVRLLRVVLYAQVVCWLAYAVAPSWPWWAAVLDLLVLVAVVVAFHPVLKPALGPAAGLVLVAGVTANMLTIAAEVSDALGWRAAERLAESGGLIGLTELIWAVLVLVAQRRDGRWRRATVGYGIASLVAPIVLILAGVPLRFVPGLGNVYFEAVSLSVGVLTLIWMARSAHDLADPDSRPAPPRPLPLPLPARPHALAATAWLTVAARIAACVVLIIPALVNLASGHLLWITPHVPPMWRPAHPAGDVLPALWWAFEAATGAGGVVVLVLIAAERGTRRTFRVAVAALLLTAVAGLAAVVGMSAVTLFRAFSSPGRFWGWDAFLGVGPSVSFGSGLEQAVSPLWFTAACVVSATLLWWARVMRAARPDHDPRLPA
ncbi:hypothetical protein [Streptosporangium sp. NPDC002721]|uniref:hypothetical protein n=1 Tax=Streptosporangium sp. NPDC002721 TaxID=3366188 RepID=UPI0036BE4822